MFFLLLRRFSMKKFMVAATTLALTGACVAVAQAANVQG